MFFKWDLKTFKYVDHIIGSTYTHFSKKGFKFNRYNWHSLSIKALICYNISQQILHGAGESITAAIFIIRPWNALVLWGCIWLAHYRTPPLISQSDITGVRWIMNIKQQKMSRPPLLCHHNSFLLRSITTTYDRNFSFQMKTTVNKEYCFHLLELLTYTFILSWKRFPCQDTDPFLLDWFSMIFSTTYLLEYSSSPMRTT